MYIGDQLSAMVLTLSNIVTKKHCDGINRKDPQIGAASEAPEMLIINQTKIPLNLRGYLKYPPYNLTDFERI